MFSPAIVAMTPPATMPMLYDISETESIDGDAPYSLCSRSGVMKAPGLMAKDAAALNTRRKRR